MRRLLLAAVVTLAAGACSEEEANPVDLGGSTSTTAAADGAVPSGPAAEPGSLPATPHAIGENPQARAYAEQQCLDDPAKAEGVIRIVDPSSDEVVGEVIVDCAQVRGAAAEP